MLNLRMMPSAILSFNGLVELVGMVNQAQRYKPDMAICLFDTCLPNQL